MRKLLLAGATLFALAQADRAWADDMQTGGYAVYNWAGLYAGVNLGVDWGHSTITPYQGVPFPAFFNTIPGVGIIIVPAQIATLPSVSGSATSIIGGGQAGWNWQNGPWVFGIEGDIDGTGLDTKASSTLSRTTLAGTQTVTANIAADINWMASLRGRIGYAWGSGLYYATGGLALAGTSVNTAYSITEPVQPPGIGPFPQTAADSHTIPGWTVGGGGEWALGGGWQKWTVGVEYRHTDLGNHDYNLGFSDASIAPFNGIGGVEPTTAKVHFTEDQVTLRLNFHWN